MPDRQVVSVSPDAESVAINPSLMTHSIVILDANKNNLNQDNDSKVVDEIQLTVNPSFWPQVAKLCQEGKVTSRNYLAFSSAALNPEIIGPMLKELNVSDDTSVFLRSPTVSLDYGKTQQVIYALIVFKDATPRIFISDKEPIFTDAPLNEDDQKSEGSMNFGFSLWLSFSTLGGGGLCSFVFGEWFGSGTPEAIGFILGLILGCFFGIFSYFAYLFVTPNKADPPGPLENP